MEASGTPAAQPPTPPPPPPPAAAPAGDGKASGGIRLLAVIVALVLAFGSAVMIVLPLNPDDTPRCEQVASGESFSLECYDMTKTQQLIQNIFAWPAGILGAITVLLLLYVAVTGRGLDMARKTGDPGSRSRIDRGRHRPALDGDGGTAQPPPGGDSGETLDGAWRALAVLLALALLFAAVVMTLNAIDVADATSCSDRAAIRAEIAEGNTVECYEHSDGAKTATVFFGFASAAFALIAALCALMMAFSARMSPWLMPATAAAIGLGAVTIVINNI